MTNLQNSNIFRFIKKHQTYFAFAIIGLFALVLLRSAFYSIGTPDESFYLTIPYRIIKGDSLLVDEWHASQFSSFLLYLPMKLYLSITGNTEGIILYFRCLFVFCQTAVSVFTFCKMKNYGTVPALVSALLFLMYVPEEVKMLDYYTMSLMGFQVAALTLFCTEKLKAYQYIFAGIVFACAVTAQPFNCLIYFAYCIAVLVYTLKKKNNEPSEIKERFLSIKPWFYITIGIVCVALIFCVFLFSQVTFSELINNLSNLFGGHDHTLPFSKSTGKTDMFSFSTLIKALLDYFPMGFCLCLVLFVFLCVDKNRLKHRTKWLSAALVTLIILIIEYIVSITATPVPILFRPYIPFTITFFCLMLSERKDKNLFAIYFTGIIYVFLLGIISQALDYIGVIGLVISNCTLAPSFKNLYNEINPLTSNKVVHKKQKIKNTVNRKALLSICVIISLTIILDIASGSSIKLIDDPGASSFGRENVAADEIIDKGPLKGIYVNHLIFDDYSDIISDLNEIKEKSCERILVAGLIPWTYFYFDEAPATFTTWYIKEELNLYDDYYHNKDKIPQSIYVPKTKFFWIGDHTSEAFSQKDFFAKMFSTDSTLGKSGHIMYINQNNL